MSEEKNWNAKLFGCCDDLGICCCGCWCTSCLFGSNAKQLDGSNCFFMCCAYWCLGDIYQCWIPHYFQRTKLRAMYGLRQDPICADIPATLFCSPCALCQEAREIKSRMKNTKNQTKNSQNLKSPVIHEPSYIGRQPFDGMPDVHNYGYGIEFHLV